MFDPDALMTQAAQGKLGALPAPPSASASQGTTQYAPPNISVPGASGAVQTLANPTAPDFTVRANLPTAAVPIDPDALMTLAAHGKLPPPPSTPDDKGILANIGAGTSEAVAGALGWPVDRATEAINLGLRGATAAARGLNSIVGGAAPPAEAPQITNPVGGSEWFKQAQGLIGANPDTVQPVNEGETLARAGGAGAAGMLLPWAGARALPALGGIPGAVQRMLGAGTAPTMATAGFTGGAAGQGASDAVPGPYKPIAGLAGNVLGGSLPIMARAGAASLLNAGAPLISHYVAPLTAAGQQGLAGQRIANAATDIGAVNERLANPAPPLVAGSEPTTFQATADPGLGTLERVAAKNNSDAFVDRAAQQNAARVRAIGAVAKENASPTAVGQAFRAHLGAIDQLGEAATSTAKADAQNATTALGGGVPVGADAQTTALQSYGRQLRSGLDEANQNARDAVSRLYDAVDPDGKLVVDMTDIKRSARDIAKDIPKNAAPLEGDASAIMGLAQMQPRAQTFREVAALRMRITDALRIELYDNGRSQTYRILSQLLGAVDDTLTHGVEAGGEGVAERLAATARKEVGGPVAGVGGGPGVQAGEGSPGGEAGVPDAGAAGRGTQRGSGVAGGNSAVAAAAPGRARKPESLIDFLISKGGIQDQGGDLKAIGADDVHHQRGGRLVNPRGVYPDYAREAAEEAGFLRPGSTIRDLYDAIAEHVSGRPVYRASEQAEGDAWENMQREGDRNAQLHEQAVGQVHDALPPDVRLSDQETDHAARLVMEGAHPEQAIAEASRAGEEAVLQRNAEVNALGHPGVPLAAQQAEMPAEGGLTPNFDPEAAVRYRAANAAHAERVGTYEEAPGVGQVLAPGQRKGEWRLGDSQVAATIFNSGKGAAEHVQAFLKGGGDNADLTSDIKDYASFSLRRAAENADGTLDPGKTAKWMKAHREALTAFPDLAKSFETAAMARETMDEAMARHLAAREEFEKSAAAHFLGDADPVTRVGKILRSDTADATMRELADLTAKVPAAREGLRRAVVDYINGELPSNSLAGDTAERQIKNDVVQTFLRRALPAMRHIFEPEEIESMQNVAADIQRSQRSVTGTKLPGGSNTAQDIAAGEKLSAGKPSVLGTLIAAEAVGEAAQHAAGPIGRIVGMVAVPVLSAMRQEGLKTVDDLVSEAMLHPELARALLTKVPPAKFAAPVWQNAGRQILALSGVSALRARDVMQGAAP